MLPLKPRKPMRRARGGWSPSVPSKPGSSSRAGCSGVEGDGKLAAGQHAGPVRATCTHLQVGPFHWNGFPLYAAQRGAGAPANPRPLLDDILAEGALFPAHSLKGTPAMSITAERKQELMKEFATAPGDTGSPEVQVAVLSERIRNL